MSVKPARWAVNPAMVAPSWRWAWRGLKVFAPLWDISLIGQGQGFTGGTNFPTGITLVPSPFGEVWRYDGGTMDNGIRSPFTHSLSTGQPFTLFFMMRVEAAPSDQTSGVRIGGNEAYIRYFELGTGWQILGSNLSSNPQSGTTACPLDTWMHVFWRQQETSTTASMDIDVFDSITGAVRWQTTISWTGGQSDGIVAWFDRGANDPVNGDCAVAAYWDYGLSDSQVRELVADPFGPIRPAGTLIVSLVESGTLHSGAGVANSSLQMVGAGTLTLILLYATADGTINSVVNEVDTTVNLYASVDDSPSSPTDTDWINNTAGTGSVFLDLTNMPSDFGTMDTLKLTVRWRGQTYIGNKSIYAQIFQSNETTSMSDEVLVATATGDSSFANTTQVTFTGLDTSSGKAVWDGARIRLRWA